MKWRSSRARVKSFHAGPADKKEIAERILDQAATLRLSIESGQRASLRRRAHDAGNRFEAIWSITATSELILFTGKRLFQHWERASSLWPCLSRSRHGRHSKSFARR